MNHFYGCALKVVMAAHPTISFALVLAGGVLHGCAITTYETKPIDADDPTIRISFIEPDEQMDADDLILVMFEDGARGAWLVEIEPQDKATQVSRVHPDGSREKLEVQQVEQNWRSSQAAASPGSCASQGGNDDAID